MFPAPVDVILDTDIGNDIDDALALALLHALESRGECRLLAVTITKDHPLAAAFTDAVNGFSGRGDVPIGVVCGSDSRRGKVSRSGQEAGRFQPAVSPRSCWWRRRHRVRCSSKRMERPVSNTQPTGGTGF